MSRLIQPKNAATVYNMYVRSLEKFKADPLDYNFATAMQPFGACMQLHAAAIISSKYQSLAVVEQREAFVLAMISQPRAISERKRPVQYINWSPPAKLGTVA